MNSLSQIDCSGRIVILPEQLEHLYLQLTDYWLMIAMYASTHWL